MDGTAARPTSTRPTGEAIFAIERPDSSLLLYYLLSSLLFGPLFFIPLVPLYFRYHTMRYRFDAEGVQMRWGLLFRKEISLTYARIQDIHLQSNILERWLGLARVEIQTASGSARAEMTIEGLPEYRAVRDFLYGRMRGTRGDDEPATVAPVGGSLDVVTANLREVTAELRLLRATLERAER